MALQQDPDLREAERRWLSGGSALPVVNLLAARGAPLQAAAVARLALARPGCQDAPALEAILDRLAASPPGGRNLWRSSRRPLRPRAGAN